MDTTAASKLKFFQDEARACTRCHDPGLIHVDDTHGVAKPMLQRNPTGVLGVLLVGEAPNWDDTYDPDKGYLTYDKDTDPTGRFQRQLFVEEVGLTEAEIDDVLFTNSALCLPKGQGGKYPVTAKQMDLCQPWLVRLISDLEVRVVISMGATALRALDRVEKHDLTLQDAGKLHPWFGRQLLPLYHASALGRVSRPEAMQRQDIRALGEFLGRRPPSATVSTSTFEVRDDRGVDLDALARLRARCEFDHKPAEFLAQQVEGSRWIAHAHDSGRLVGFARALSDGVSNAYVSSVMVDPDYRRRGIGTALLQQLMRDREAVRFVLHTRPDAKPFYQALGFADATDMLVRERR